MSSAETLSVPTLAALPRHLVLAKWLGYFMLIDLLFLPYFQALIMPISLPLVLAALCLTRVHIPGDRHLTLLYFLALAVFVSVAISLFNPQLAEHQPENIKRAIQLLTSFAYFFYFRWLASQVELHTQFIASGFVLWFGLLAAAFFLDPAGTGETIRAFYGRLVTSEETLIMHLRFSYQFTDPNTAAYFLLIAVSPLLMVARTGPVFTLIVAVVATLTFFTQSKGALMALGLVVMLTLYPPGRFVEMALSLKRMALLFTLLVCGYLGYAWLNDVFDSNALLRLAYDRLFNSGDQLATGGSRFAVWSRFMDYFTPLPFGQGFTLEINGDVERPHSDLVRLMFSYGIVALVPALMFFFSRLLIWPALVMPALMAFLINTLIDEQKLLSLFLCLLAIQVGSRDRARNQPAKET